MTRQAELVTSYKREVLTPDQQNTAAAAIALLEQGKHDLGQICKLRRCTEDQLATWLERFKKVVTI